MLTLLAIMFTIIVAVGVAMCVFLFVIIVQRILQRHYHLLERQELCREFVVVDLAAAADHSHHNGREQELQRLQDQQQAQDDFPLAQGHAADADIEGGDGRQRRTWRRFHRRLAALRFW